MQVAEDIATEGPASSKKSKRGGKRVAFTPHSRKRMESHGYLVAHVEKYNSFTKQKNDLFGLLDLLCVRGEIIIGLQVTSWDGVSDRVSKIREHENYPLICKAIRIKVHGWQKVAGRWICRELDLS